MVKSLNTDKTFTKDDRHSYENFKVPKSHDQPPSELSASELYNELDSDEAQAQEPRLAEPAHEYDEPILMSSTTPSCVSSCKIYCNIPDQLDQDLYTEIDQTDPPAPSEGATFPEEFDSINEDNLNPNEMQLWLLLQMQKMVQRMEDVYGACKPSSPRPAKRQADKLPMYAKSRRGKSKAPPPPSSPDRPPEVIKQTISEDTESEPTRQHLYENLDIKETFPPPISPRIYQVIDGCKAPSVPPSSRSPDQWPHRYTLPSHTSQSAAHPKPYPVQPRAKDSQVRQHQIEFRAGKKIIACKTCIFSSYNTVHPKPPPVQPRAKDIQVRQHQIEYRAGKKIIIYS